MSDETNPTPDWITGAIAHLSQKLKTQETVSAEDLQDYTTPPNRNSVGSVFRRMFKDNMIRKCDRRPSKIKAAHGRQITIWRKFDANRDSEEGPSLGDH